MKKKLVIIILVHFILSACVPKRDVEPDYIDQAKSLLRNTNWEKVTTLNISMVEFFFQIEFASEEEFSPFIEFEHLKPYKLIVKNDGKKLHAFVSPEFFNSVAIWKIVADGKEQLFPEKMEGYMVFPKKSTEFFFVPVTKGKFLLFCSVGIHRKMGMHRMIIVK